MAKIDILSEVVIARPLDAVAAFAQDPENAPVWYENIKSVEWETPPPIKIGSKLAFVANFLGRRMAYTYEIVELIPNERLTMRSSEGPFPMETIYTWEAISEGETRMSLRNRGNPSGFSALFSPFVKSAMRRANQKDLELLKRILEKG